MSQRNNVIREKKKETVGNANVWARRQAMAPTTSAGFVPTDYHFEELGFKSYSLEDSSVKWIPQLRQGHGLQKQEWLSILNAELESVGESSSSSTLQQLPPEQLRLLLTQLLPSLLRQPKSVIA